MPVGQAEAILGAARAYLYEASGGVERSVKGRTIDMAGKIRTQFAAHTRFRRRPRSSILCMLPRARAASATNIIPALFPGRAHDYAARVHLGKPLRNSRSTAPRGSGRMAVLHAVKKTLRGERRNRWNGHRTGLCDLGSTCFDSLARRAWNSLLSINGVVAIEGSIVRWGRRPFPGHSGRKTVARCVLAEVSFWDAHLGQLPHSVARVMRWLLFEGSGKAWDRAFAWRREQRF